MRRKKNQVSWKTTRKLKALPSLTELFAESQEEMPKKFRLDKKF
jgi:hypothetical protein